MDERIKAFQAVPYRLIANLTLVGGAGLSLASGIAGAAYYLYPPFRDIAPELQNYFLQIMFMGCCAGPAILGMLSYAFHSIAVGINPPPKT